MTERENLLRTIKGEEPAWVPRFGALQHGIDKTRPPAAANHILDLFARKPLANGKSVDIFGVEYEATESAGGQELPMPNHYILEDITRWRDVIKTPALNGIDWEAAAKRSIAHIDRQETAVVMSTHVGYFQHLMNFMGFSEGLIAMCEEPEEVHALFDYLGSFYETIACKLIDYIKPDVFNITDDTATARGPFISPNMYRELVKPYHARLAKAANEREIPINMHNCGLCQESIEDWRDFNVKMWNPAQVMNDLVGIKKKYGNDLILIGCWDSSGPAGWNGASEELVRSEVRRCIDTFAPGGGFCFWATVYGPHDDEEVKTRAMWITDEYNMYGRTFYHRQG